MKIPYVSMDLKTTGQKKGNRAKKKGTPKKSGKTNSFLHRSLWIPVGVAQEILWFTENLGNSWGIMVSTLRSWPAHNSDTRRLPAHGEGPR